MRDPSRLLFAAVPYWEIDEVEVLNPIANGSGCRGNERGVPSAEGDPSSALI